MPGEMISIMEIIFPTINNMASKNYFKQVFTRSKISRPFSTTKSMQKIIFKFICFTNQNLNAFSIYTGGGTIIIFFYFSPFLTNQSCALQKLKADNGVNFSGN